MTTITESWPLHTRHCFPCWDEPNFKATFAVKLTVPENLTQLSNMPINCTNENSKSVCFTKTPIMSPHVFAMVIGDYDCLEKLVSGRVCVRIFTSRGMKEKAKFALESVGKIMEFYESYFDVKYSLSKLDLVAVEDLGTESMSNWGLMVLKDCYVLFDKETSQNFKMVSIVEVLARELVYQWFGNLVTVEW